MSDFRGLDHQALEPRMARRSRRGTGRAPCPQGAVASVHVGAVARRRGLGSWMAAPSRSGVLANAPTLGRGISFQPGPLRFKLQPLSQACAVRSPEADCVFFLTVRPVSKSLLPCTFSATKSAPPGGLGLYQASVCQNGFWERAAE